MPWAAHRECGFRQPPADSHGRPEPESAARKQGRPDGSGSTDEDDGIVSYRWRQIAGPPVALSDPAAIKPAFAAPVIDAPTEDLGFELTVTDSGGLRDMAKVVITEVSGK